MNHTVFSGEPGNLANRHCYKFSGLANRGSTLDIAEKDGAVVIAKSSKKSKAGALKGSACKKNARRTNTAAGKEAASVRPDLKVRVGGARWGVWAASGRLGKAGLRAPDVCVCSCTADRGGGTSCDAPVVSRLTCRAVPSPSRLLPCSAPPRPAPLP